MHYFFARLHGVEINLLPSTIYTEHERDVHDVYCKPRKRFYN